MSDEIEAVTEGAKAVREIAVTGGKAIDAGREAGGWLDRIFGKGIEDTVAYYWSDKIRRRRIAAAIYDWGRLVDLLHKVEAQLSSKGITEFRIVPPKVALALIENATVEDNNDLHSLWANLLATALDPSADEVHRKYVSILSELSSDDAVTLQDIYSDWTKVEDKSPFVASTLKYGPGVDGTACYSVSSIITLNRLGLIAPTYVEFETYEPGGHNCHGEFGPYRDTVRTYGDLETVTLTELGDAFCKAVLAETASRLTEDDTGVGR